MISAAPRFAPIPGFPGYAVSDHGDVVSWKHGAFRMRRLMTMANGYKTLGLSVENIVTCLLVHRIVLEAFVGPCPEGMETRHLDGNPANNRLENLTWGTIQENADDRGRHGTASGGSSKGVYNPTVKLTEEQVFEVRNSPLSNRKMALKLGVSKTLVSMIRRGKIWKHLEAAA